MRCYYFRLVKENRSLKANIHKQMEREEQLKAAIEKVNTNALTAPSLFRVYQCSMKTTGK